VINQNLHRKVAVLDRNVHRDLRIGVPAIDWSVARDLNSMFVASVEFGDACCEYPIVFVDAGTGDDGKRQVAPIAVFGLRDKENLYVDPADSRRWRANYLPALLRTYPFGGARVDPQRVMVVIDEAWAGWSKEAGQPLFDAQGEPTDFVKGMRDQLEKIEGEVQRTKLLCDLLLASDLLTGMRFDATLPDGQKVTVDGFLTVDEKKLAALPDAKVVEFHRNGVLALIHAHQLSLRHMRRLVEWRLQARPSAPPAASPPPSRQPA
jgi:hypothetical protein